MEIDKVEQVTAIQVDLKYSFAHEKKGLMSLFKVQSYNKKENIIRDYIKNHIKKLHQDIKVQQDEIGNLLITKGTLDEGEFFPCLIAHMDTVHDFENNFMINHLENQGGENILWASCKKRPIKKYSNTGNTYITESDSRAGIGGDDKNGIWLNLKLLSILPKLKVVFTVGEEVGGIGAEDIDLTFFEDVGYMIEPDRRGNSDLITDIFGGICSKKFIDTILPISEKYRYKEESGMFTDILILKERGVEVSAINLSVGYYSPHTFDEFVVVEDLFYATQMVEEFINILGNNRYQHSIPKQKYKPLFRDDYNYNRYYRDYDDYLYGNDYDDYSDLDFYGDKSNKCHCNLSLNIVNIDCDTHNPLITKYSGKMCRCGEELELREFTLFCPFCSSNYVNI